MINSRPYLHVLKVVSFTNYCDSTTINSDSITIRTLYNAPFDSSSFLSKRVLAKRELDDQFASVTVTISVPGNKF
jgi:hypothetical protein